MMFEGEPRRVECIRKGTTQWSVSNREGPKDVLACSQGNAQHRWPHPKAMVRDGLVFSLDTAGRRSPDSD